MSPFATRLKVGTTALVLEALVREPRWAWPRLVDPLNTLQSLSRDATFRWEVRLEPGEVSTAIEVQRRYLEAVHQVCDLSAPAAAALADDWGRVLDDLERDVMQCRDRLDWVAKLGLVRQFQAAEKIRDDDPWLRSLDLEYHRLDLREGLYYGLEQAGAMVGIPDEAAVRAAITHPPATRASVRGKCIQKFAAHVTSAQWDHITLQGRRGPIKISLMDLFGAEDIARWCRAIETAQEPEDLRSLANVAH